MTTMKVLRGVYSTSSSTRSGRKVWRMGTPSKSLTEKEEEIKEEYLKTLQDLTFNSKPLIDVLTEVAEENKEYASTIADCIVEQLEKVADPLKLPILYLIDSIIKNISQHYMLLFCKNIDRLFAKVYEQGDENVRNRLLKLRFTWNGIIPLKVLSSLDKMVQAVNPSWPNSPSVHVNPKFVSISTHVPASNGNITTTTHVPQAAPAFRIAPVSSQLINAAKRVRDPRLRKIELQQIRPPNNNSSVTKEAKTSTSSQIDAKIDQKNDRRQRIEVKRVVSRPKPKEPVRRPVEEKVTRDRIAESSEDKQLKRKSDQMKSKKDKPTINVSKMVSTWVTQRENERTVGKVWSKEERDKGLKAIAKALIEDRESGKVIGDLSDKYPKIAEKLEKLMKEIEAEKSTEKKSSPVKKSTGISPAKKTSGVVKPVVKIVPKTISKKAISVNPSKEPISTPVVVVSTSELPAPVVPVSVPVVAPVSVAVPIAPPTTLPVPAAPAPIISGPVAPAPVQSAPVAPTLTLCAPAPILSASVAPAPILPDTVAPITIVPSPAAPAPMLSPAETPIIPIPPPAPIISSTAAAESKSQDIDYRQIFALQLLKVPPVVAEVEPKVKETPVEDVEIIDVDALPSKPRKRKISEKKHHRDRKRRRVSSTSSNESVSSRSSADSLSNKRKTEVVKISEEEDSRSGSETESKKSKPDDSFYSQTASTEEKLQPSNLIIMSVSETPRAKSNSPPIFPKFESNFGANFNADFTSIPNLTPEIPPTDLKVVKMIDNDPVRSINIDGVSREIRHYGSQAVVFMNWDDPRDISFFNGVRNVIIDDKFGIPCSLNAPEVETLVYGRKHRFRLGVPTRELFVNGVGYECYFGGPPLKIRLDFKWNSIKLEGPPPSVNIGTVKRLDIVAGKISIIINDQHKFPVFLDAKPQYIQIDDKPVVLMFIDGLKRVLINNVPFRTDFGGPSQSFKIMNQVYNFRFTVLPLGIAPGINLSQMVVSKLPSPPPLPPQFKYSVSDSVPTPPLPPAQLASAVGAVAPPIDLDPPVTSSAVAPAPGGILADISIDELFQKLVASGIVPNIDNKAEEGDDVVKTVDFDKPETLKQRQPALIKMLYSGIQCGSCGLRFPAEQTLKYSQHLDWHFRLNRKGKDGARTIHSRKWYYGKDNWIKFQEMEDNSDRGTSWFDNHPVTEYTEEILEDVPCIPAGSHQNAFCELCRDRFEQFYNDESDEWQLRNAIKANDAIYHPTCYQDYQIKLDQQKADEEKEKESQSEEPLVEETKPEEKPEPEPEPSNIDYDDDSDIEEVQVIEEPIEEIIIQDDGNEFDDPNLETLNTEDIIAAQQEIVEEREPSPKPIKVEDLDDRIVDICDFGGEQSFDEPETVEDSPQTKSGHEGVVTIDGNIELTDSPAQMMSGSTKIKINISKNINDDRANSPRIEEHKMDNDTTIETPLVVPTGESDEEKLVPHSLKSRVTDAKLTVYPPVSKGKEESSLCSIM